MEAAHEGMVESPGDIADQTCAQCHPAITEASMNSLHMTLTSYDELLYERTLPEDHPVIEEAQTYHCNSCHASCGDCHVSQPSSNGGGLLEGHVFVEEPSMSRNCTACHGSRVKDEYYGAHEGIASDVHFRARMSCADCHTADEMHGIGKEGATHRYDGEPDPSCESCHEDQIGVGSGILQHEVHGTEIMSCQTCHSTTYTNCTNCHLERSVDGDIPYYTVESHDLDFAIGYNAIRSNDRPYMYNPVRHVPVDIESFSFYGVVMDNFDAVPTWKYATPHNIQRITPQTESCLSCHENDDVFLTTDKVVPEELAANATVIVDQAPPMPEGYENVITGQEDAAPPADDAGGGDDGGFWGDGGGEAEADAPADDGGFWGDGGGEAEADAPADEADSFWGGGGEAEADAPADEADSFWGGGDAAADDEAEPAGDDNFWTSGG